MVPTTMDHSRVSSRSQHSCSVRKMRNASARFCGFDRTLYDEIRPSYSCNSSFDRLPRLNTVQRQSNQVARCTSSRGQGASPTQSTTMSPTMLFSSIVSFFPVQSAWSDSNTVWSYIRLSFSNSVLMASLSVSKTSKSTFSCSLSQFAKQCLKEVGSPQ